MNKVLVIGMGQLGKCIRDAYQVYLKNLSDSESPVISIDFATRMPEDNTIIDMDITDKDDFLKVVKDKGYTFIVNCAAYTNVNSANSNDEKTQLECMRLNRDCLRHIAEFCEDNGCNLIHVSTDYVFSGRDGLVRENSQNFHPMNFYGKSKREGEDILPRYMGVKGKYMIIRTSSLYSQYGSNFVKTMIKKFEANENVSVIIDNVSSPTNANDFAHMIVNHILVPFGKGEKEIENGAWHFTNEGVISWYDFAQAILEEYIKNIGPSTSKIIATDSETVMNAAADRGEVVVDRPMASILSKDKLKSEGYEIKYWKTSLNEFFVSQYNTLANEGK